MTVKETPDVWGQEREERDIREKQMHDVMPGREQR